MMEILRIFIARDSYFQEFIDNGEEENKINKKCLDFNEKNKINEFS